MLLDPVTLHPAAFYGALAILCLAVASGVVGGSDGLRIVAFGLGAWWWLCGTFCLGDWIIYRFRIYDNMSEWMLTQRMRYYQEMTDDARTFAWYVEGYGGEGENDAGLMAIGDDAVLRESIIEIDRHRRGDRLQPEREYKHNQAGIRLAHDVLEKNGIIKKGSGPHGPTVWDKPKYELTVSQAKGLV